MDVPRDLFFAMEWKIDQQWILKEFLEKHKAEVCGMVLTEFDEKAFAEDMREEGRIEGLEEGLVRGHAEEKIENISNLMQNLSLTAEKAMEALGIPAEEYDKYKALL